MNSLTDPTVDKFASYVRGVMFSIQLTGRQCDVLSWVDRHGSIRGLSVGSCNSLFNKGLLEYRKDKGFCLTRAGKRLIPLLKLAGCYKEE